MLLAPRRLPGFDRNSHALNIHLADALPLHHARGLLDDLLPIAQRQTFRLFCKMRTNPCPVTTVHHSHHRPSHPIGWRQQDAAMPPLPQNNTITSAKQRLPFRTDSPAAPEKKGTRHETKGASRPSSGPSASCTYQESAWPDSLTALQAAANQGYLPATVDTLAKRP